MTHDLDDLDDQKPSPKETLTENATIAKSYPSDRSLHVKSHPSIYDIVGFNTLGLLVLS